MQKAERELLSQQFRQACSSLSRVSLRRLEELLLETTSVKDIRNVQLWTRDGAQKRNFISERHGAEELRVRVTIARAVIAQSTPSRPQKTTTIDLDDPLGKSKFREYINNQWIGGSSNQGGALNRIQVGGDGSISIIYDSDSSGLAGGVDIDPDDSSYDDIIYFEGDTDDNATFD